MIAPSDILTATQRRRLSDIAASLAGRLAALGERESGLYNYYARKLEHDALIAPCDLLALRELRARRGAFRRVFDIGAGVGQVAAMLAADGFDVVAIDSNPPRYEAMAALLAASPEATCAPLCAPFPEAVAGQDVSQDAALALGCTFTAAPEVYESFEAGLARFAMALIDFSRLFTPAQEQAEWRARAEAFARRHGASVVSVGAYEIPHCGDRGELFAATWPARQEGAR